MLVKYSVDEVVERAARHLSENSEITNFYPGSIARSLIEAISYIIGDLDDPEHHSVYGFMEEVLHQGYLSRATGEYLDLIGDLFSYKRREELVLVGEGGEMASEPIDDETYRYEISQQVTVLMSSNETALRFYLLLVDGVRDVVGHEYMYGTGSFLFTIIEESGENSPEVLNECREVIQRVKGFGIRGEIQMPTYEMMDLDIQLIYKESDEAEDRNSIRNKVRKNVMEYIQGLDLGEALIYHELVEQIMEASPDIYDFEITKWDISEEPVLLMNQTVEEDERFGIRTLNII